MSQDTIEHIYICLPCICPVSAINLSAPPEQEDCIKENCPSCDNLMWVSKKKRAIRDKNPDVQMICAVCGFIKSQGYETEIVDINNFN